MAVAETKRMDQARAAYVHRHFHTDWRDPLLYDIQVNTGRVSIEEAARGIAELVAQRVAVAS
jgi:cytidylate kinase